MANGNEVTRFFIERVANEALAKDQGYLPIDRDGLAAEASWYRDDAGVLQLLLESGGQEKLTAIALEAGSEQQQIADALEGSLKSLQS